jgi:hypothetical protein
MHDLKSLLDLMTQAVTDGRVPAHEAESAVRDLLSRHGIRERQATQLVYTRALVAAQQLRLVRKRNEERRWGFTEDDFVKAAEEIPDFRESDDALLVLVPHLADHVTTFHELLDFAVSRYRSTMIPEALRRPTVAQLRLRHGVTHVHGLRWEVIGIGSLGTTDPADEDVNVHAAVLAAAALHTEWVKMMERHVWIPGYRLVPNPGAGPQHLVLWSDRIGGTMCLHPNQDDSLRTRYVAPRLLTAARRAAATGTLRPAARVPQRTIVIS